MKVYKLNDYEWYMAETLDAAIALAMEETGLPRDEAADDDAYELGQAELDKMIFRDDDGTTRSFAAELQRRIDAGEKPGPFAGEE